MATFIKRRGKWRAQVRISGYPAQSGTFKLKSDARAWAARTEEALRAGRLSGLEARKVTLNDLQSGYLAYLRQRGLRPRTQRQIERHLEDWCQVLGGCAVGSIGPEKIADERDRLAKTVSPATVNRRLAALSGFFRWAVRERRIISSNPCSFVGRGKEPRGRVRYLSTDERARLFAACLEDPNPRLHPLVVVGCYTGLRAGELLALTWDDVDLSEESVMVQESKNEDRRQVPLVGPALEALREWGRVRRIDNPLVFVHFSFPRAAWNRALKRSGVSDFRFHDLRHTAASYLAQSGASLAEIAEILGHRTLAMAKRYAHLGPARLSEVAQRMAERFS